MTYAVLNHGYTLRGYNGLPFGLGIPNDSFGMFFNHEEYEAVLMADGHTNIEKLTETQKKVFGRLIDLKAVCLTDAPTELEPEQKYRFYPVIFKSGLQWSITGACNYRCKHCFMSSPENRFSEPTWEQCESAISQMSECGIQEVQLTGGEPLVSPHFYRILDECIRKGIRISKIYSNGSLVNRKFLDELDVRGLRPEIILSFDGIGWHDWLRGIDGAEKRVLDAFMLCRERGYTTVATMTLHKNNIDICNESLRLLDSMGVYRCNVGIARPDGLWAKQTDYFLDREEALHEITEAIIPRYMADKLNMSATFTGLWSWDSATRKSRIVPIRQKCGAKDWTCDIVRYNGCLSPEGYLLPCMSMIGTAIQKKFDSIYDKPMRELLSDSAYTRASLTKVSDVVDANEECRDCIFKYECGAGCRGCAVGETGTDFFAINKETCHLFKAGWVEKLKELNNKFTAPVRN